MAQDKVIPTEQGLAGLDLNDPQIHELIQRAQDADAADKKLTVKEALKKYKKAVFWACLLSVSLIMEGYDLVMVCLPYSCCLLPSQGILTSLDRLLLWTDPISATLWRVQRG